MYPIAAAAQQSPLSLTAALREAEQHAFANRAADAMVDADRARARLPLKGILPSARIESGVIRTTDPIGAFGTTLRQRLVTPAAFDPARLNDPAAVTNVQAGLVLEMPVFNADAWSGKRAADAAADAADASRDWTHSSTRLSVVRAYYGGVLAAEKVTMLEQAQRAADAAVRQAQSMVNQGLVTKADALQSAVRVDDLAAQVLSARSEEAAAREQFAMLLGRGAGNLPLLPRSLPSDSLLRAIASQDTLSIVQAADLDQRGDVRASHAALRAASADRARATATLLPRVNSFARYDWNTPSALFGGRRNWTLGVIASWSLFGGGSELADMAGTAARERAARAGDEATQAQGRVETTNARRLIAVALQRLTLADHAAALSGEAHRLVEKRYAGGLATVAELLAAESAATAATLNWSGARFAVLDALVAYRRASGTDLTLLSKLDVTNLESAR